MINASMSVGQRKIAAAQRPEAGRYWRETIGGATATTFRPDTPASPGSTTNQLAATLQLDAALFGRLRLGTRDDPRALSLMLTATTAAMLHTYTGDDDVLIGNPAAADSVFATFVPIRIKFQADDTLRSLLGQVHEATTAAQPYLDFPTDIIGPSPAVIVALTDLHSFDTSTQLGGGFAFVFVSNPQGLRLDLHVDPARYSKSSALSIGQHYVRFLEQATAYPAVPFSDLDLMLENDAALFRSVNDTAREFPQVPLTELFSDTVIAFPNKVAVVTSTSKYTFSELDAASTQIARTLIQAGVSSNQAVGLLARRSFEMLAAIVGILKAGAAYLPLDPALPAARIQYLLEDSATTVVLTQKDLAHLVKSGGVNSLALEGYGAASDAGIALPSISPRDAAYVIYTSGSTGMPKGVVVEHRSIVNRLKWMQRTYPIGPDDVILQKTPISFDVSVWELFWWLIEGASVSLLDPGDEREPASVVSAIEKHGVTTMHFVPTMLGAFLEYIALTDSGRRTSSLRRVFASGEALGAHNAHSFAERLPHAELVNLYGPTEATVDVTHHVTNSLDQIVPIGKPIDNIRLYVLNQKMMMRPIGMVGELFIAGIGLARGYLNRPTLTEERFISGAHLKEDRLYRTGDLVRWLSDGSVEYFGRNDSQVKLRGFRIELGEVEHRLRLHPAVQDSVVIMRQSSDHQQHLLAYIVASEPLAEQELLSYIGEALPAYMVPDRITQVDGFPLSPSGKLDHKALPEPNRVRTTYVAPRTNAEKLLADIWAEVLGLDQVGISEGFFSLGGNSIHFVSVLAKARKNGLNFTFQQLFQYPTIEKLLKLGGNATEDDIQSREFGKFELLSAEDRAKIPPGIEDAYPMSMMQAGMIYQSEVMNGNSSYHDVVSYVFQGSIDTDLFRDAVRIFVAQNPVFRTSYRLKEYSDYLQVVHEQVDELPLTVLDLRHIKGETEHEAWYAAWFREEQSHLFLWDKPGLVRLHLHILQDDVYRYTISQHNSALDGWSKMQVHTELFSMYYALLRGDAVKSVHVENHLRNFIGLERYSMNSEAHTRFWRNTLADWPVTKVPRLRTAHSESSVECVFQNIAISNELSDRIVALAETLEVPVKDVLLAAHLKFLTFICGSEDILTGYEHSGRPELLGADRALGVFTNSMPLRVKVADGTWADLIRQTYNTEANLLPYRRYPMAKIKQLLRTTDVLFETVFNFVHFYTLKEFKKHPEFSLLDVRVGAITEFPLRVEFSRHHYTDKVDLILQYHPAVFDQEHVMRMGGYIVRALELMVAEPETSHNTQALLSDFEINLLQQHSHGRTDGAVVTDRSGNLVPIGTLGRVVVNDDSRLRAGTLKVGKWIPGGILEEKVEETQKHTPQLVSSLNTRHDSAPEFSAVTRKIATIWSDVLKIPFEQIHASDDFFEIGGNSLAALKVVLRLEGEISLRDMMRCSRLHELAAVAEESLAHRTKQAAGLLVKLSTYVTNATASLVCLPYAGGNAVHFGPFADAMAKFAPDIAVFSVELPGHDPASTDKDLRDFATTTRLIAEEIQHTIQGPVLLWGHCVGAAIAIEVAGLLAKRGVEVSHLFLAAKLLIPPEELRQNLRDAEHITFAEIRAFFEQWSGADVLDRIGDKYEDLLARVFRHDSLEANAYLLARSESSTRIPLKVPSTFVVADDDSCTAGYEIAFQNWGHLVANIQLHELRGGGHFFMRTKPREVADLVSRIAMRDKPPSHAPIRISSVALTT